MDIENTYSQILKVGLGAKPSPIDVRDYPVKQIIPCARELPAEFTTDFPKIVFNQKHSNMCVGCSIAMQRYIYESKQSGITEPFSPAYAYANRGENDYKGEGAVPREVLKQINKFGIPVFSSFSEFASYDELVKIYQANKTHLDQIAYPYRTSSFYAVTTNEEIKGSIVDFGSVSSMIPVYKSLYYPDSKGIVNLEKKDLTQEPDGYHQIVIYGYNDTYWICQNSWGENYGDSGTMYLPIETYPFMEHWVTVDTINEVG